MSYLTLFFVLIIAVIFLLFISGGRLIVSILRLLFGRTMSSSPHQNNMGGESQDKAASDNHKKIFSKDEGEYIDYEDIKE